MQIEEEEQTTSPPVYDELEGAPDEIADFITSSGVRNKYQCVLKEVVSGGKPGVLETYNNEHPSMNDIGRKWGPGDYIIFLAWWEGRVGGGRDRRTKELGIHFPERAWRSIHEEYIAERSRENKKKKERELEAAKTEAQLEAVKNGKGVGAPDPIAGLKETMDTLKSLGLMPQNQGPKIDLAGIAALIAALAPVLKAFGIGGGDNGSNLMVEAIKGMQAQNALLLKAILESKPAAVGTDPASHHMNRIMDMAFNAMGKVVEFQDMLKPAEKETLVDRIFGAVDRFLPAVLDLAKLSQEQREKNYMYKLAAGSPEMVKARQHPDLAIALVEKWDDKYGFQTTNEILEVAGIPRPVETMGNMAKYPSEGFGTDGKPLASGNAEAATEANAEPPEETSEAA